VTGGPSCPILKTAKSTTVTPYATATRDPERGGCMAKLHARPSNQYRYEHYDPRSGAVG
jgi:hypothetical protein